MSKVILEKQKDRPICCVCNIKPVKYGGFTKKGFRKFQKHCGPCNRIVYEDERFSYRKHKKSFCESCGFIPEHPVQLDVDHINGNHKNNDLNNLQTLCANCHRLKTYKQRYG